MLHIILVTALIAYCACSLWHKVCKIILEHHLRSTIIVISQIWKFTSYAGTNSIMAAPSLSNVLVLALLGPVSKNVLPLSGFSSSSLLNASSSKAPTDVGPSAFSCCLLAIAFVSLIGAFPSALWPMTAGRLSLCDLLDFFLASALCRPKVGMLFRRVLYGSLGFAVWTGLAFAAVDFLAGRFLDCRLKAFNKETSHDDTCNKAHGTKIELA